MTNYYDLIKSMTPDEQAEFVKAAKELAEKKLQDQQKAAHQVTREIGEMSADEIAAELQGMHVRDDPVRFHRLNAELQEKLKPQPEVRVMDKGDYFELSYQRDRITQELNELLAAPIKDRAAIREKSKELEKLTSTPDPTHLSVPKQEGEITE